MMRPCRAVLLLVMFPLVGRAAESLDRGTVALRRADGSVYVGWRLLASDPADIAFNVYRGTRPDRIDKRITPKPIRDCTNLVDKRAPAAGGERLFYAVREVINGKEQAPGPGEKLSPREVAVHESGGQPFIRIPLKGNHTFQKAAVADLDGDGRYDYVIKQPDFNVDPYEKPGYWKKSEDTYKLEAYRSDGTFLWRFDLGWSIEEGVWYSPYVVFDLDGDGKAEVYAKAGEGDPRDADGRVTSGPEWLVKIDGVTGKVVDKRPWPDRSGYEKYNYYSRNLLGVAYLDGRRPHLVVERGTYSQIKIETCDPQLKPVWKWNSLNEKEKYSKQGMHGMHCVDVDGDGRDEIVIGSAVVDDDGRGLWTRGVGHPDACYVGDIDPDRPGLEIFYGVEHAQERDGVCLVDARTGVKIWGWDSPTLHVHGQGMAADVLPEHPGQECYAGERDLPTRWLYTASGKRIGDRDLGGLVLRAVWWDGDPLKEVVGRQGVGRLNGPPLDRIEGRLVTIADCLGDWREEVITSVPGELRIYTTTIPAASRHRCLMQDRLYRLDAAMASMGYHYPPQLSRDISSW